MPSKRTENQAKGAGEKLAVREDPFASVMHFGRHAARTGLVVGFAIALISHGAFAGRALASPLDMRKWADGARDEIRDFLWSTYDIEVAKPEEPAPREVEEEKNEPEEEENEPTEVAPAPTAPIAPAAQPPAAAQAGKILTAPEDPDEPVDLTGDGFVTGNGDEYVGGVTAAAGTGSAVTYNKAAAATGTPGGTGTGPAPPPPPPKPKGPDRSRAATISRGSGWSSCPFPAEADTDQVDYAVVTLVVTVRPNGTPRSVRVLSDPGHGFGRAARLCALSKRYTHALDQDGKPIVGTTPPIRVTFTR
ncbi:MAG: hypothetical protein CSA75_00160 [Sorangium cellulosum]|nr:MAG: hypothetical protein CSA75_00160 [Sorangium cellulosum]